MNQPAKFEEFDALAALALDIRSCWHHGCDFLWREIDPAMWDLTHNPWAVLRAASGEHLKKLQADPVFSEKVKSYAAARALAITKPAWFQQNHANQPLKCVAYFSMEFMLSEALPIYSGGLGNVAGDQLKAASDLGVPVIGVGLLYQQGYFRQGLDRNGNQQALYPFNDPGQLPIRPLRQPNGEWLRLEIALPGYSVWLRTWQVQIGRVRLYLLDTNDLANFPEHRAITSQLYGGGPELRLKQEIVLGIGGWRLLNALGLKPEVCHLNEGHAALAVLERACSFMHESDVPFAHALAATRVGNLFTTHTAVASGFDRFAPELIKQYLGKYTQQLGITLHDLLALGRQHPDAPSESFNMAYLAIRGSGAINAVSQLHEQVSRQIFAPLFPRWPVDEVPVGHVTNGIHVPTWDSAAADAFWTQTCGKDRWNGACETMEQNIRKVPAERLWEMRNTSRRTLIEFTRQRLTRQLAATGGSPEEIDRVRQLFDPHILTLGFARRFATYKRPNLLLHDPERLVRLLTNSKYPVQIILAGKAHPADQAGQDLIHQWVEFIWRPDVRPHAAFLCDYDMLLTEQLVGGVDVWLNTPRRPWEACGTSGMKVLVNGGINLSELDGWWAEAYTPEVGWALGDGQERGDDSDWDAVEANALYNRLEREVIPEFYNYGKIGIPMAWVKRMRESMAQLTPRFSAGRVVREYTERYYLPAAIAYRDRSAVKGAGGKKFMEWQAALQQKWNAVHLGKLKMQAMGDQQEFATEVYLGDLDSNAVKVELYANGLNMVRAVRQEMTRGSPIASGYVYTTKFSTKRPTTDFTVRVIPCSDAAVVPLEAAYIRWQQ